MEDLYEVTPTTIASILDEYAQELEASRENIIAPMVLGIDEKHICHEMRGVFVEIASGRLLQMTEKNVDGVRTTSWFPTTESLA